MFLAAKLVEPVVSGVLGRRPGRAALFGPIALFVLGQGRLTVSMRRSENDWVGKWVVQKAPVFQLKIDDKSVDVDQDLAFRVAKVNGKSLLLSGNGLKGWAPRTTWCHSTRRSSSSASTSKPIPARHSAT